MQPDTDLIVDGLLKWWQRRFPMGKGCRNPHAFKLAAACNDYGIPQPETLAVLLRYVEQDFTAAEVRGVVRSAYRNTAAHGSKQWRGHGGGAPATRPAYTPSLIPAQAKAVEDRLAEELSARYAWKPWDMEPQPAAEVGAMAAPTPTAAAPPPRTPPPPQTDELGAWLRQGTAQEREALVRSLFTTARPRIGQHEFNALLAQAAGTTPRAVVGSLLEAIGAGGVKVHPSSLLHLP